MGWVNRTLNHVVQADFVLSIYIQCTVSTGIVLALLLPLLGKVLLKDKVFDVMSNSTALPLVGSLSIENRA